MRRDKQNSLCARVALLDLDLEFGNVAVLLDLRPERTLAHLAGVSVAELDEDTFAPLLVEHASGVRVMVGAGAPEQAELVTISTVQQSIERLRDEADYVLVDTPRSFSEVNLAALDMADVIWLVSTPHLTALKATADCLRVLEQIQVPMGGLLHVLNQTAPRGLDPAHVTAVLGRNPDANIPYTPRFDDAANAGRPLVTTHPAEGGAVAIRELAARLMSLTPSPGEVRA